jgi:hypothetical protein
MKSNTLLARTMYGRISYQDGTRMYQNTNVESSFSGHCLSLLKKSIVRFSGCKLITSSLQVSTRSSECRSDTRSGTWAKKTGLWMEGGKIWIPPTDVELTTRLMIVAHCGPKGHRSAKSLKMLLQERFCINRLGEKAIDFCAACLLCLHTKGGKTIPLP